MFIPKLYPMAIDTLNTVQKQGIKQIILSGQYHNDLIAQTGMLGVSNNVDCIIGSSKKDASNKFEMLLDLLQKYKIRSENVLLISDTIFDWEISCQINCHCVLLSHGHQDSKILSHAKTKKYNGFGNDLLDFLL
jgi:phosphoglycolate phosphatase